MSEDQCEIFNSLIVEKMRSLHGQHQALRTVLRECENEAGQMRLQAAAIELAEKEKEKEKEKVHSNLWVSAHKEIESHAYTSSPESSVSDISSDLDGIQDGTSQEEGIDSEAKFTVGQRHGVNMSLSDLQLVDIDVLDIVSISLSVRCTRCTSLNELNCLQPTATKRLMQADTDCKVCHRPLSIVIKPHFLYERSNLLATVQEANCLPMDLLPLTLSGQCSNCTNLSAFRNVQPGRWHERACGHCHRRLAFYFSSVGFNRDRAFKDRSVDSRKKHRPTKSTGPILPQPGQPLPNNGACQHYRHSYRWLRFPCCGRRFPCDLCHEEGTDDGHEMKWAHRMVCGFCSVEQPVNQRCKECGRRLTSTAAQPSGKATNFWEGGKGQRDHKFLSRKDPHKWSSSKKKTHSRKEFRVGTKGKERTLAKTTST